jgi:hypothetical protein
VSVCLFSVCLCAMLEEMHHILLLMFGCYASLVLSVGAGVVSPSTKEGKPGKGRICICACVCQCVFLSVCLSVCLPLSLACSVSLSLSRFPSLALSLFVSLCVSDTVCAPCSYLKAVRHAPTLKLHLEMHSLLPLFWAACERVYECGYASV